MTSKKHPLEGMTIRHGSTRVKVTKGKPRLIGYHCEAILRDEDGDPILDDDDRPQVCGKNHPTEHHARIKAEEESREPRRGYTFTPRITKGRRR